MFNNFIVSCFVIFCSVVVNAQTTKPDRTNIRPVTSGYFINPYPVSEGIFLCNEKSNKLFFLHDNDTVPELFINTEADFRNLTVSFNETKIAFRKFINKKWFLLEYNIITKKTDTIFISRNYCSNLSYSKHKQTAFSSGNTIYVISNTDTIKHIFKEKITNAVISPCGKMLAILNQKGILRIIDTQTAKTIRKLSEFCTEFKWSPDSKKIVYNKYFAINTWDTETNTIYNHGEGTNANWSKDSEYIIFQKNAEIEMKFVNSDLYISKFNADEKHQITNTVNLFEMQPVFINKDTIVYLTYENRQIIKAGITGFILSNKKILFKISE